MTKFFCESEFFAFLSGLLLIMSLEHKGIYNTFQNYSVLCLLWGTEPKMVMSMQTEVYTNVFTTNVSTTNQFKEVPS